MCLLILLFNISCLLDQRIQNLRNRQGSNLRGHSPTDFKSVALTTRPRLLLLQHLLQCETPGKIWIHQYLFHIYLCVNTSSVLVIKLCHLTTLVAYKMMASLIRNFDVANQDKKQPIYAQLVFCLTFCHRFVIEQVNQHQLIKTRCQNKRKIKWSIQTERKTRAQSRYNWPWHSAADVRIKANWKKR